MGEPRIFATPAALRAAVGQELGPGAWVEVGQARIDLFATATGDRQWIHTDPARAADGPFGTTIAHGFLTLSLLPSLLPGLMRVDGVALAVNYGLNRVRFPAPLPAGSRVRATARVLSADDTADGAVQLALGTTVRREGGAKPVCVAETLTRYYPA
jgi:acyl dehydratase